MSAPAATGQAGGRPVIAVLGSLDTKGPETAHLADAVAAAGGAPVVVDTSAGGAAPPGNPVADVTAADLAAAAGLAPGALARMDRAPAVRAIADAAAAHLQRMAADGAVHGLVTAGGSNAALVFSRSAATLPFGVPKVAVTTMAVVDARAVIGDADVTLIYPVADVDGLNSLTTTTLRQAAAAVVAMARTAPAAPGGAAGWTGGRVGATMFGVTTPCVQAVRAALEARGDEVLVFHANGTGGRSLEGLADGRALDVVVDVTTTELADLVGGGELSAGDRRLSPDRAAGVPRVVVPGAVDMLNFGPPERVPASLRDRVHHVHNDNVTLVRTSPRENARVGWLIGAYAAARDDATVLLPLRGVSALDRAGGPFEDVEADGALFEAIEATAPADRVRRVDAHINDPAFAEAVVDAQAALR